MSTDYTLAFALIGIIAVLLVALNLARRKRVRVALSTGAKAGIGIAAVVIVGAAGYLAYTSLSPDQTGTTTQTYYQTASYSSASIYGTHMTCQQLQDEVDSLLTYLHTDIYAHSISQASYAYVAASAILHGDLQIMQIKGCKV